MTTSIDSSQNTVPYGDLPGVKRRASWNSQSRFAIMRNEY